MRKVILAVFLAASMIASAFALTAARNDSRGGASPPVTTSEPGVGPRSGPTYNYVIITTNAIASNSGELEHFIHLKEFLGHSVKVVTESDFGGLTGQAPNGRAEKIRQWLLDNKASMGIEYVLLIGDPDPDNPFDPADTVGDIPMKMFWPGYFGWSARDYPSDYFYADLDGNWDLDGDQIYGEGRESNAPLSPDPAVNPDYFSVRWTGYMKADFNEEYIISIFTDGGVKLHLGGSLVIDNWDPASEHPPTNDEYTVTLTAGLHPLTIEYKEHTDEAIVRLHYRTTVPDTDPNYVSDRIIPLDHLRNEADSANGLTGRYYNNIDMSGSPVLTKSGGQVIDCIWGTGDKGAGGPETEADVYVGRIPVYDADYPQLDEILRKIIRYETDPSDISWRKSILLPMTTLWPGTPATDLAEGIRNDFALAAGFDVFRIYDDDYGPSGGPTPELWPTTPANVVGEWKNGYGMVTYDTHGSSTGAQNMIDTSMVSQLDDTKPSFVYMTACTNGHPETHNNLGYALLKHGAIATYSATRVSWGAGMPWTFDPTSDVNHNLAYFTTKKVIDDGTPKSAGKALYLTKGNVPYVGGNGLNYNLYGDPDTYLLTTKPNYPPVASVAGPIVIDEGETATFDASASYDPEGDPLEYRWDLDNSGTWDTPWSSSATTTLTYGDDYAGQAKVEVQDKLGFTATKVVDITVNNIDPTITDYEAYILVNFSLRVAGEKWHNVQMYVLEDGTQIAYAEVFRMPGSPDDQMAKLGGVKCDVTKTLEIRVLYTPADDPVNGQINGASPAWVNVSFDDGDYILLQHNFNVKHPDRWQWDIGVNQFFVGHSITFEAAGSDPGSDDLTFTWDWDDGTADGVATYYNDGVGPDPYPSIHGTFPCSAADSTTHAFMSAGTYDVKLTLSDDDGGFMEVMLVIALV